MTTESDLDIHHWNHRVIRHDEDESGEVWFAIHEVFYRDNKPVMWTEDGIRLVGESPEDLVETINRIQESLKKPILKIVGDKLEEIDK
jgi:hypothetical protein